MPEFTRTFIGITLITVAMVAIVLFLSGVEYLMLKYGTQIIFGSFLGFVGWIAYGAYKNRK